MISLARQRTGGRRNLIAITGIIIYTLLLCLPAVFRYDGVSLYDEITHFDYAYKLTVEHSIPKSVEPLSNEALEAWACRDGGWTEPSSDICDLTEGGDSTRFDFPVDGVNYNGFHPPGYYAVTGVGAQLISAIASPFGGMALFSAMRVMSALWLAAGLSAFYLVLQSWTKRPAVSLGTTVLLGSIPAVTLFGFTITPDSAAPLAGAAALHLAHRMADGRPAVRTAAGLSFLVASTKLLSIVAILSVVSVGLIYSLAHLKNSRAFLRWAGPFAGAMAGTVLSFAVATLLTRSAGEPTVENAAAGLSTLELVESPLEPLLSTFATHVGLANPYWMPGELNSPEWAAFSRLLSLAIIAAPFILMWRSSAHDREFILGFALLASVLTVPVLIQVRELALRGEYFANVPPRYSLALMPLAVAALAIIVADRSWGAKAIWAVAGLSLVLAVGSINGVFTV